MGLMRREIARAGHHPESRLLIFILIIAALLFAFGLIAQEVVEGEPLAFDRSLLLAFRDPANPSVPIGPPWLLDTARDVTSLGGLSPARSQARRCMVDAGSGRGRCRPQQLAQARFCPAAARFRYACGAGLHRKLSERACHVVGHYLPDIGCASCPNQPLGSDSHLPHVVGRHFYRPCGCQPRLPRRSLSDRRSRRLVHRHGVGHGMLGIDGVAAAPGRHRAARACMRFRKRPDAALPTLRIAGVRQGEAAGQRFRRPRLGRAPFRLLV
jgi:hypothetical protein